MGATIELVPMPGCNIVARLFHELGQTRSQRPRNHCPAEREHMLCFCFIKCRAERPLQRVFVSRSAGHYGTGNNKQKVDHFHTWANNTQHVPTGWPNTPSNNVQFSITVYFLLGIGDSKTWKLLHPPHPTETHTHSLNPTYRYLILFRKHAMLISKIIQHRFICN